MRNTSATRWVIRSGFTLAELLVVIGILALIIGFLLPALSKARAAGQRAMCLADIRSMEMAQWNYLTDNHGFLIQAGRGHGSEPSNIPEAWFTTLQSYYQNKLVARCPSDNSPYWPDGGFVPNSSPPKHRTSSYCINDFVAGELYCPWGPGYSVPCPPESLYTKMSRISRPSCTIQFAELTYTGDFAGADHCHIENWVSNVSATAALNVQTNAHGGQPRKGSAMANYGFLDGHAETLRFDQVFKNFFQNKFDPAVAQ